MKDWMKYALAIIGGGIFFYLISRGQQPTTTRVTTPTPTTETPTNIYEAGQGVPLPLGGEQQEPEGMVEAEASEEGMVEVTRLYTKQENQNCAYTWLTQSCPIYQQYNCSIPIMAHYMMAGRTHYFTYNCLCFKEGTWGVPLPTTIIFNILMKDCQLQSYSYKIE